MLNHYAECHYAKHHILFTIMLNVIMPSVFMLIVISPNHSGDRLAGPKWHHSGTKLRAPACHPTKFVNKAE